MSRRSAHPLIRKAEPSFRGPFAPLLAVMALIGFACLPQPLSWLGLPVALIVPGHLVLLIMGVADDYNVVSRAALAARLNRGRAHAPGGRSRTEHLQAVTPSTRAA